MAEWTTESVAQLRSLAAQNITCGQIAMQIGRSRNAVIGKLLREGIPHAAPKRIVDAARRERRRVRKVSAPNEEIPASSRPAAPPPDHEPETFVALGDAAAAVVARAGERRLRSLVALREDSCRWPIGDVGAPDFGFCPNAAEPGESYCKGHCRIAYTPYVRHHRNIR